MDLTTIEELWKEGKKVAKAELFISDLSKAVRPGLVKQQVPIQLKGGKMIMGYRWIDPNEELPQQQEAKPEEQEQVQKPEAEEVAEDEDTYDAEVGDVIELADGTNATITSIGEDGITAKDDKGNVHQVMHHHVSPKELEGVNEKYIDTKKTWEEKYLKKEEKLDLKKVKKAFGGLPTTETENGFIVDLGAGRMIEIRNDQSIAISPEMYEEAYGKPLEGNVGATGSWQVIGRDGLMQLTKGADENTLSHEIFHAAMDLVLSKKEKEEILKTFGTEEAAAKAYSEWSPVGKESNSIWDKIFNYFSGLIAKMFPKVENIFEGIHSGDVWRTKIDDDPNNTPLGAMKIRYSAGVVKPITNTNTQAQDIAFGTVNNRVANEVEVFTRLLGTEKTNQLVSELAKENGVNGLELLPTRTVTKAEMAKIKSGEWKPERDYRKGKVPFFDEKAGKWRTKTQTRILTYSLNPCIFAYVLERAVANGHFDKLLDHNVDADTIADEYGISKEKNLKAKRFDDMTERDKFIEEVRIFRKGSLLGGGKDDVIPGEPEYPDNPEEYDPNTEGVGEYEEEDGGEDDTKSLSDNGKAGKSADFLLGTCHPSEKCSACYAAKAYFRMSSVRKAFRNNIYMMKEPKLWAKKVAAEAAGENKDSLPVIRLLGSGDITINQMVDAFNELAQVADRPIHIFSRRYDQLEKLKGTQKAPIIKMGSVDIDLYKRYSNIPEFGPNYIKENAKRGIQNALLYTGTPEELELALKMEADGALPMIFPTSKAAADGLPDNLKTKCCPCDSHERNFHQSCKQCAIRGGGCFMHAAGALVDKEGNLFTMEEQAKNPDRLRTEKIGEDLVPISLPRTKEEKLAGLKSAMKEILIASQNNLIVHMASVKANETMDKQGKRKDVILKDVRFDKALTGKDEENERSEGTTNWENAAWGKLYGDALKERVGKMLAEDTFYLPGGIGQPALVYDKGQEIKIDSSRAQEIIKQSTVTKADVDRNKIPEVAKQIETAYKEKKAAEAAAKGDTGKHLGGGAKKQLKKPKKIKKSITHFIVLKFPQEHYVIKSSPGVPSQAGHAKGIGVAFNAGKGKLQSQPKIGAYHAYKTMSSDAKIRMRQRKQAEVKEEKQTDIDAGIQPEPKQELI